MNEEQIDRYSRHITLPAIGRDGQQRLLDSHVLIVGLGGLGSPAAMYLAAAGIGKLSFADFDTVELSNLQRQIAHTTGRVRELKTHSARTAALDINPDIDIDVIDYALDREELDELIPTCSAVLDCSDNFPTRFAVNASCVANKVPLITGAAIRFDGQVMVVRSDQADSACYRCLYTEGSETAETCEQTGILGPVVGLVGCIQALETIKVLCDIGDTLTGRLLLFDGMGLEFNEIQLKKSPDCPVCSSLK